VIDLNREDLEILPCPDRDQRCRISKSSGVLFEINPEDLEVLRGLIEHNGRNAMILAVELDQASTNPEICRGLIDQGLARQKVWKLRWAARPRSAGLNARAGQSRVSF